jgi:ABC-2 type transport system ATP-binding protein
MIKAEQVVKWFGPTLAVDHVSFCVERGEVLGFLGPNGAGKSTTMRVITGFLPLSSGTVTIDGHDIEEEPIEAKMRVGYLPENAPAYSEMGVVPFLSFVAEVRGMKGVEKRAAVERAIDTCFLERVRHQRVDTLSKGYRHRLCFAQALLHDPDFLILDEPTDGLDPNQKHEMRQLIKSMGKEKAIIVSTHILEEVEAICSRVIIIDRGKLVFNGSPDELKGRSSSAGSVVVRVLDVDGEEVSACLKGVSDVEDVSILDQQESAVRVQSFTGGDGTAAAAAIGEALVAKGWRFDELRTLEGRLDEVFREITIPDTVEEGAA